MQVRAVPDPLLLRGPFDAAAALSLAPDTPLSVMSPVVRCGNAAPTAFPVLVARYPGHPQRQELRAGVATPPNERGYRHNRQQREPSPLLPSADAVVLRS
jgi:hypothetical protein